ncbi:CAP, putative [Theobroma cacao]|uniref:CAP, putative n=1 Tax=Theobroma cacao TaxID=3641 RepID=A0A061EZL9_THECC|nr:CAP, putative [Theobroma cacao]
MATTRTLFPQSLAAALTIFSLLFIAASAQAIPQQNSKPRNNIQKNGNANGKPRRPPTTAELAKKIKSASFVKEAVSAHNAARVTIGQTPMVWNYTLAYFAKQWAKKRLNDCKLIHSYGPYGENLFWGGKSHWTPSEVVKFWVEEKAYYDPKSNTCATGQMCGHYTQIVWKDSVRVGCARINCYNGKGMYVICSYDPPGNYINEHPFGDLANIDNVNKIALPPLWKPPVVAPTLPVH